MDPAPEFASPPDTVQFTPAAPPPVSVAENCSTGTFEELVALHPVQLVSMEAVPGVTENVPLVVLPDSAPPPQPASTKMAEKAPIANTRAGHCLRGNNPARPPCGFRGSQVSTVDPVTALNSSGAFLILYF